MTNKNSGKTTVVQADDFDEDFVTITIPRVESGQYSIRVRLDPIGETQAKTLNIKNMLWDASPGSLSTNGGIVTLSGFGMPEQWPHNKYRMTMKINGGVFEGKVLGT